MNSPDAANQARQALDVLVVGEALTDIVTSHEGTTEHPGGSPANVAYGLGRLGVTTGLLTAVGDDDRGAAIYNHLQSAGVTLLPGSRSSGRTSTATSTLAPDGSASYDFEISWDIQPLLPALLPKVVHTGSIATFLAPGAETVKSMLQQFRPHCMVTYDPNIRPALLGSQAEAKSVFEELVHLCHVVKLSDEDAKWLYPGKGHDDVATHVLHLGADLTIITQGSTGSLLATSPARLNIPAVETKVVDTIGAGDSYMSALILGLLSRGTDGMAPSELEQLGHTAAMAAAITVGRRGAHPPTEEELRFHLLAR